MPLFVVWSVFLVLSVEMSTINRAWTLALAILRTKPLRMETQDKPTTDVTKTAGIAVLDPIESF